MRYTLLLLLLLLATRAVSALDLQLVVEGVSAKEEGNVRAFLSLEREKTREALTPARLKLLHGQAPEEIRRALQPFGYFQPRIDARLEQTETGWIATYRITPGPRIRVGRVDFQVLGPGRDDPLFADGFPIESGDELDQAAYDQAKQALLTGAVGGGYLHARYSRAELRADLEAYRADIHLHLDTGPRFRFGEVRFLQDELDPQFLDRYLTFAPSDPFEQEKLLALQGTLIDSEYFSSVEVRTRTDQAEDEQVPVDLVLSPNKPNRYRFGAGFSTDTGPRLSADWLRRRIGRQGHRMSTELRLALPHSAFKSEYLIPLERPAKDSLSFSVGADRYDTETRVGTLYGLNTAWSVGLADDWRRTLALGYSYEDIEAGTGTGVNYHLIPSVAWSRLRSDGEAYIQRGSRLDFEVLGAAEPLLSSSSFVQLYSSGKIIRGFGDWRLLNRLEVGASWAEVLADLPASRRFFAGGDNSVRGFTLDSIGPTDAQGDVVGGRFLAVGSAELERRLVGKWSAAAFVDAGNAFDPDYDNRVEYSLGLGLRWLSPVGPIRLDLASALSREGNPWRLHIVVGPEL